MLIAVPKETYDLEKRVMVLPDSVRELIEEGHEVRVQVGAGLGIRVSDSEYQQSGAKLITEAKDLYADAEMVVKLKSPMPDEYSLMENLILFCMMHSEQNPENIYHLGERKLIAVQMENVRNSKNQRIIDQTGIAGEAGVYYSLRHLDKLPRDSYALVLGYGGVSTGAIQTLSKIGMKIKILRRTEFKYINQYLKEVDLLVNGICWPKSKREAKRYLVTRDMIRDSNPGLVILDLAVDHPGPIETMHPTTYANPFYLDEGHVHIGVYGYPGLVSISSSIIYDKQVRPITLLIANNKGLAGIESKGELGKAVYNAILDPNTHDWQSLKPKAKMGSPIE